MAGGEASCGGGQGEAEGRRGVAMFVPDGRGEARARCTRAPVSDARRGRGEREVGGGDRTELTGGVEQSGGEEDGEEATR